MGFFSNIKNKARAQIAPVMPMAPQPMPRPSVMPRRGGSFLSKIRDQAFDKIESGKIPARSGFLRGQYFGPPQENMSSDFRMPQKRGGLSGLFRKLQEQIKNQQRPQQMPQQNLDFLSRLPPNMMPEVDFSNIPQLPENFQFNPQMGQGGRSLNFADYKPQDRQMMAGGRDVNIDDGGMVDFLNSDPQQKLFGIETRIGMLQNQLKEAEANRDRESFDMIVQEINNADAQRIEIMNSMKPNPITQDFQQRGLDKASQQRDMQIGQQQAIDDMLSRLEKKN